MERAITEAMYVCCLLHEEESYIITVRLCSELMSLAEAHLIRGFVIVQSV
jgi:hypothetical protein